MRHHVRFTVKMFIDAEGGDASNNLQGEFDQPKLHHHLKIVASAQLSLAVAVIPHLGYSCLTAPQACFTGIGRFARLNRGRQDLSGPPSHGR
ncbi:hypothetical protein M408DRAFT_30730 [Serendipita vermifera MAFF 305830]|uniref:Uncharacterized protein n=1 Tax=Serendipita vermifera MAFF 305830 TaxID=933852 RepID=A0A0C3AL37_SERVB|nr:hypothetical protein M408DRAFT_30730 [Serendipita vermifera MAFF 305830]